MNVVVTFHCTLQGRNCASQAAQYEPQFHGAVLLKISQWKILELGLRSVKPQPRDMKPHL